MLILLDDLGTRSRIHGMEYERIVLNVVTVEPPNRGHFGTAAFVLSSEMVLFSDVA